MRLPAYQDLSKEQEDINNLPVDGSYLVAGPPGTGKTVIALYRAQMIEEYGRRTDRPEDRARRARVLMFNGLLVRYTTAALDTLEVDGEAKTCHEWLYQTFARRFRAPIVNIGDHRPDWDFIERLLKFKGAKAQVETDLIIDEGQDLPPQFYDAVKLMAANVTVFADENQTVTDESCTFKEIREAVGIGRNVHRLRRNYRNTLQVAEVAECFYTTAKVGTAEPPERVGRRPQLRQTRSLDHAIELIRTLEANNDTQEIGVFVADEGTRKALAEALEGTTVRAVHTYYGNKVSDDMDMGLAGIRIMCSESAKGLEFDTVFIVEAQDFPGHLRDHTKLLRRFYVMTSRARDGLYLLWSGDTEPSFLEVLPDDLVERRRLSE